MRKDKDQAFNWSRVDVWTRGVIWGMHLGGLQRERMQDYVSKKDGSQVTLSAIDGVIAKVKANPEWKGEDSSAGGRPRTLSDDQLKALAEIVFKERGRARVTVAYCKKQLTFLRLVHDRTVCRSLHHAGLKWLARRAKAWVPSQHKEARVEYCQALLRKHAASLSRYAYTDGACFYLARGPADTGDKKRRALGRCVWRRANGSDGLFDDNISPSLYAKAQGLPVKIWGFLANGRLEYWVLPADPERPSQKTTNMNGEVYNGLIACKFADWRRSCFGDDSACHLVQDHEKCLWQPHNLDALKLAGCHVVADFPKSSPDLNAIEGVWSLLRRRLEQTEPADFEDRAAFLVRLRRTVRWLNENRAEALLSMRTNQKERAQGVIDLEGARTEW